MIIYIKIFTQNLLPLEPNGHGKFSYCLCLIYGYVNDLSTSYDPTPG